MNSQKIFSTLFLTGLLALSSITAQAQSANGPAEFKKRLLEKLATGERTQPAEHSRSTAERENQPRTAQHIRSVESDDQTSAESAQAAREPGSGRVESLIDVRARLKKSPRWKLAGQISRAGWRSADRFSRAGHLPR